MANFISTMVERHLKKICADIGSRPVGSDNNHRAGQYIGSVFEESGYEVEVQGFDCLARGDCEAKLRLGGEWLEAIPNTFSPPCNVEAPFTSAGSIQELAALNLDRKIVILYGELNRKNPAKKSDKAGGHGIYQKIIRVLEKNRPDAVITVSHRGACLVPSIENPNFNIPSAVISFDAGLKLLKNSDKNVCLSISNSPRQCRSSNVIGRVNRNGNDRGKIVVCAHYDTKYDTPGALDNGSGVAVMLALAQSLARSGHSLGLEFIAFSGEEYFLPGEIRYVEAYEKDFSNILMAINVDSIGHYLTPSSIAFCGCSEGLLGHVRKIMKKYPGVIRVDPWQEGDHTLFWQRNVPSIAISSECLSGLIHTEADIIDGISIEKLVEAVLLIKGLIGFINDDRTRLIK